MNKIYKLLFNLNYYFLYKIFIFSFLFFTLSSVLIVNNSSAFWSNDITNISFKKSVYKGKKGKSYEIVTADSGEPVIGKKSYKFVAIPFDCGSDETSSWYSDCGNSYTSNYDPKKRVGGGDRMRSELTSGHSKASRFNKSEFWVSFSIYIPEDYQTISPTVTSVYQIYESGKGPNLKIEDLNGWLTASIKIQGKDVNRCWDCPTSMQPGKPRLMKIIDMKKKWTHFKIHTKATSLSEKGFYKFYINDNLVAEYNGKTAGSAKKGLYIKAGIYQTGISRSLKKFNMVRNWKPKQDAGNFPTQIIYMDNLFKTNSKEKLIELINKYK